MFAFISPRVFSEPCIEQMVILFFGLMRDGFEMDLLLINDTCAPVSIRIFVLFVGFTSKFTSITGNFVGLSTVCSIWQTCLSFPGSRIQKCL